MKTHAERAFDLLRDLVTEAVVQAGPRDEDVDVDRDGGTPKASLRPSRETPRRVCGRSRVPRVRFGSVRCSGRSPLR